MAIINDHYLKLAAGYLFPEISRRVSVFAEANPAIAKEIIRCGIGDVTEPLPAAVIAAMHAAVDELANRATFRGYGPATGYDFVREAIVQGDFRERGRIAQGTPAARDVRDRGPVHRPHLCAQEVVLRHRIGRARLDGAPGLRAPGRRDRAVG